MQKHLRNVLSRLMPDVLLDLGLAGAIETLVLFWRSRKPGVSFVVDVAEEESDDRSSAIVFRIVQESLSNAMRHADASRVDISVRHGPDGIEVDVTDDGRGLPDPAARGGAAPEGLGLLGMRERVRSVGGILHVGNRTDRSGVHVRAMLLHDTSGLVVS